MSASSSNVLSAQTLQYFFYHICLPSKLPNGDDTSASSDSSLIEYALETLSKFLLETDAKYHAAIQTAMSMIANMLAGRDQNTAASFHITAQNAGLMLHSDNNSAIFELFELSPTNGQVYATKGRLIRHFPAIAIGVPLNTYAEDSFQQVLTKTLVKMSYEVYEESVPKAKKAKQNHDEERDTNNPQIVTELLGSFLRGMGHHVPVTGISKNTREEVMWNHSKLPWRRSPVWLLIRTSLQLIMDRKAVDSKELYKSFIIFLLSRVLSAATELDTASETLKIISTKVSRRLLKLRHPTPGTWLTTVRESVSAASSLLGKRWRLICDRAEPNLDLESLSMLNMTEDVYISLTELNDFILSISNRETASNSSTFCPTSDIVTFQGGFPYIPSQIHESSRPFVLAMVESWVAANLDDWLRNHIRDESTCLSLCNLMHSYHKVA
ncbi:hypothetical protein PT974_06936 [Cladobotryum mycophilum]|uniref:DUF6606 domain-containing protein n=1 Tax=Cladobotryum mycophilum TaxID=491253 RepID=A0ABR0SMW1_9HYPO